MMGEKTEKAPKKGAKKSEAKALQLRKDRADAAKAELELKRERISLRLDKLRAREVYDTYAWKLNNDRAHGVFSLESSVGSSAVQLAADLRQFGRTYPGAPITLNIFSPGGSVLHGLALYDTLRTLSEQGHPVTTVLRGYAASMGSILFLAGDNRLMGAEGWAMFHTLSSMAIGSLHEIEDEVAFCKRLQERLNGIILNRTKVTPALLEKKTKKTDWWVDTTEALKYGIATALG
jgi:ATP-dependent protease ClpP protease subunit